MRRSRLRCFSLVTSILLLAALCLPFVEIGDLLDDTWEDDGQVAADAAGGQGWERRNPSPPPSTPGRSSPPDVFAIAHPVSILAPTFADATTVATPRYLRPARPSFFPRTLERGPPFPGLS
jgi:hypothetical protein